MRKVVLFSLVVFTIGFAHRSVSACMCPGFSPDIDIPQSRIYYRDEFKGAFFTGRVLSSEQIPGPPRDNGKLQEVTIEVDRYWFGVRNRVVKIYTPADNAPCWFGFKKEESYFFIAILEKEKLYLHGCTYSIFNREHDGNYVDFMMKMFGEGKRYKPKK